MCCMYLRRTTFLHNKKPIRKKKIRIGADLLCKQLDFQLFYFGIELVCIQIHYDFLNELKGILKFVWVAQVQSINQSKQHDKGENDTIDVIQNIYTFNDDADILWLPKVIPPSCVDSHDFLQVCPGILSII